MAQFVHMQGSLRLSPAAFRTPVAGARQRLAHYAPGVMSSTVPGLLEFAAVRRVFGIAPFDRNTKPGPGGATRGQAGPRNEGRFEGAEEDD